MAEDGKSFLFEHLLKDSITHQTQNKIIMGLLRRSYYISVSVFDHENKTLKKHAEDLMEQAKGALNKIKKALESFEKELNQIVVEAGSTVETKILVKDLTQLVVDHQDQYKKRSDTIKKKLDQKADSTVETKKLVKELTQFGMNQLDQSKKQWETIKEILELIKVEELLQNTKDLDEIYQKRSQDKSEINTNHEVWINYSIKFLKNLQKDIVLVREVRDWNHAILKEVLCLLNFLQDIFKDLLGELNVREVVQTKFSDTMEGVEREWFELQEILMKDKVNKDEFEEFTKSTETRISAKTTRELLVLNRLSQEVLGGRLIPLGKSITTENLEVVLKKIHWQSSEADRGYVWAPAAIAVVFDSFSGLLLTGASQPACQKLFFLRNAAKSIPKAQLGDEFESIINRCNEHWTTKCEKWKKERVGEQKGLFEESKEPEYSQLPAPKECSEIWSRAFDGFTFNRKPPCVRCAYFYSSWRLFNNDTPGYLSNYLKRAMWKPSEDKEIHCAETVAAAEIYAWRNGTLVLD